jgi:hypothetical protein
MTLINIIGKRASGKTTFIAEHVKRSNYSTVIYVSPLIHCSEFFKQCCDIINVTAIPFDMLADTLKSPTLLKENLVIIFDDVLINTNIREISKLALPEKTTIIMTNQSPIMTPAHKYLLSKFKEDNFTIILGRINNKSDRDSLCASLNFVDVEKLKHNISILKPYDIVLIEHNSTIIYSYPHNEYITAKYDSINRLFKIENRTS